MLTEQQLEERKNHITGSDVAAIMGVSERKTALDIWLEKTRRKEADDISDLNYIKFGNFFEQGVADWFESEKGIQVRSDIPPTIYHPAHNFISGNIDRLIEKENAILECKTSFSEKIWTADGSRSIPNDYLFQVAHYCMCGDFDKAYIAVVFSLTRNLRVFEYERNSKLEAKILEREYRFWHENVLADIEPEPMNEKDILSIYETTSSKPVIASEEIFKTTSELKDVRDKIDLLKEEQSHLEKKIKLFMAQNETLVSDSGEDLASWKYVKARETIDSKRLKKEKPEVYDQFKKVSEKQTRRFNFKRKSA